MAQIEQHLASLPAPNEVRESLDASVPPGEQRPRAVPLSAAWITGDLLWNTRRVWSKVYRRPIDDEEATEILMNVKRFAEVLLKAAEGETEP